MDGRLLPFGAGMSVRDSNTMLFVLDRQPGSPGLQNMSGGVCHRRGASPVPSPAAAGDNVPKRTAEEGRLQPSISGLSEGVL